jgi:acylphosphatase
MVNSVPAALHATVYGRVQGVFFRAYVERRAEELGLVGWVRNLADGESIEVYAEGDRAKLNKLLAYLNSGPPSARVDRVETDWTGYTGRYRAFSIAY